MGRSRRWDLAARLLAALGVTGIAFAHHLDSGNTQVSFQVGHLGLNWFTAAFGELSGEFVLDPDGHGGHLSVTVQMASLQSRSSYWNERLRSAQWLDAEHYPEMSFRSTGIELEAAERATVHGELTLHGVTRPLALAISDIDCPYGGEATPGRCHFLGRGTLRRSDYGLPHGFWAGGDEVEILVRGD
jgi:polyisoprenoid-binding protein YceI